MLRRRGETLAYFHVLLFHSVLISLLNIMEAAIVKSLFLVKVFKIIDYHTVRLDQNNKPEGSATLGCQHGTDDHHFFAPHCPISSYES